MKVIDSVVQDTSQLATGKSNQAEWAENYRKSLGERIDSISERTDSVRLNHKLDALARKVSRGDEITANEKRFMIDKDAEKLHRAERANHSKTVIEERLKRADSVEAAEKVLAEARAEIEENINHQDKEYGKLLAEAVNKLVVDFSKKNETKSHYLKYQTYNLKA